MQINNNTKKKAEITSATDDELQKAIWKMIGENELEKLESAWGRNQLDKLLTTFMEIDENLKFYRNF